MPNPENIMPHKWPKGTSGNPKGRRKKLLKHIISTAIKEGFEVPSKAEITDVGLILLQMPREKLQGFLTQECDSSVPFYVTFIAQELLGKTPFYIVRELLDRGIDKAKQPTDITTDGDKLSGLHFEVVNPKIIDEIKKLYEAD